MSEHEGSPRHQRRGLIEAGNKKWQAADKTIRSPRHQRRGLIEAMERPTISGAPGRSPRHQRRGLIEAGLTAATSRVAGLVLRGINAAASLKRTSDDVRRTLEECS